MANRINRVIKILISSDLVLNSGWGLLAPVFAIFLLQNIALGDAAQAAKIAGFASLTYWFVKSSLQIPIGRYLDKNHGEKDDFLFLVFGMFLVGLVPFGYLFVFQPWHIYALQALQGIGMAAAMPSWCAIFTRHIDKGKEAFEWGTESTALGFGAGIGGGVGGTLAALFGFRVLFILVGTFTMISVGLLFLIYKELILKNKQLPPTPPFKIPSVY